jgi:Raf kinase inhibitor-like YbhB/YbcL family protein
MRSRTFAVPAAAFAVVVVGLAACDTDDGRAMEPPTEVQRWQLASTTPSTTSTTLAPLGELAPVSEPPTTIAAAASASSDVSGSPLPESAGPTVSALVPTTAIGTIEFSAPWADGDPIDVSYTCDGEQLVPLLTWTAPPAGAIELALAVTDDDAGGFVHWVVTGLPPVAGSIGGDEPQVVATEGENDAGTTGWTGPCPPVGEPHTYRFTLYVLAAPLAQSVESSSPPANLVAAIGAQASSFVELTGTYQRAEPGAGSTGPTDSTG